jgi:hypothetical protein
MLASLPLGGWAIASFLSGVALTFFNAVPWVMIFIATNHLLGVRLYVLKDKEICLRIQKRLTSCSHVADAGKAYGYSIGRWHFASVAVSSNDHGASYDVWMIATVATFARLTADETAGSGSGSGSGSGPASGPPEKELTPMTVYERCGSYYNCYYKRRAVRFTTVTPRLDQPAILDTIIAHHALHGHTVVFLHGPPGSGKSMIGILLAERLGAVYCNTLKPWQPGDMIGDLYAEAEPSAVKPLVIAFDEFDGPLVAIHTGTVLGHKNLPTPIADKAGWNRFFDEIARGMFPHLIIVLTSNRDPTFIRGLDPSYIRDGRVDLCLPVCGPVSLVLGWQGPSLKVD